MQSSNTISHDATTAPHAAAPAVAIPDFSPMPLRARGVLETLDLTIKVFRRYFGVLLAWSALVIGVCGVVALFGAVSAGKSVLDGSSFSPYGAAGEAAIMRLMLSSLGASALGFFCFPLMIGASACCVAGAVRGQNIKFWQCWSFTRPRYWAMLGQTLLALIMLWIGIFGFAIVAGLVIGLGVLLVSQLPFGAAAPVGILALIALYVGFFVVMMLVVMWMVLVPVVVCMEENNRNSNAMGRALSLLRGNWRRASGLMLLVWLAAIAVAAVSQAPFFLFGENRSGALFIGLAFVVQMIVWLAAMPFFTLLISLFYLDARVRNEALDLEWTSHTGTPQNDNAQNGAPNSVTSREFYPPVARAVSAADQSNIARPDAAAWNASPADLASLSLDKFTPQRVAPPTIQTADNTTSPDNFATQTPTILAPNAEPSPRYQTQVLSDESSTRLTENDAPNAFYDEVSLGSNAPDTTSQVSTAASANTFYDETILAATTPNVQTSNAPTSNVSTPIFATTSSATAEQTCAQCGATVASSQSFCMNCGARLKRDNATGFGA